MFKNHTTVVDQADIARFFVSARGGPGSASSVCEFPLPGFLWILFVLSSDWSRLFRFCDRWSFCFIAGRCFCRFFFWIGCASLIFGSTFLDPHGQLEQLQNLMVLSQRLRSTPQRDRSHALHSSFTLAACSLQNSFCGSIGVDTWTVSMSMCSREVSNQETVPQSVSLASACTLFVLHLASTLCSESPSSPVLSLPHSILSFCVCVCVYLFFCLPAATPVTNRYGLISTTSSPKKNITVKLLRVQAHSSSPLSAATMPPCTN